MIHVPYPLPRYNPSASTLSVHFDPLHGRKQVTGRISVKPKRLNACNTVTGRQPGGCPLAQVKR
jgi:hypothetical protein